MSSETAITDTLNPLPEIGQAVFAHFALNELSHMPVPDSEKDEDILDVAYTVINHTGLEADEVAEYVPYIRIAMDYFKQVFDSASVTNN